MTQPAGRAARGAALLGDDFQHLHAWSEALEAARPGSDVTAFSVEAVEAGSYDDIVVYRASGPSLYIQAKFAVDPTDGFSLDWLMAPTGSGTERPSLAQRALATFRLLQQPGQPQLRLVTNRDLHPDDAWLRTYRSPETNTLGHAVGRLLRGEHPDPTAARHIARLRDHLSCTDEELLALLSAWELRWAADLPSEQRVGRARMVAIGLHDHAQALHTGRDMIRGYVKSGIRRLTLAELRADIDALNLRARPPARVLSVQLIGDEPHAGDADAAVDLRELFAGRAGDAARGLPPDAWTDTVAPAITSAVAQLEAHGAGPVLVRAAVRLPTWFYLGTRMRHVRNWTLLAEFADQVWSSSDARAAGVHLAPPDADDQPPAGDSSGRELLVAVSVTADVAPEVLLSQQRGQLPDSDVLWLTVPTPSHTSVAARPAAAAIVDDDRVHLVIAAPRMIALFLGHRWHRLPPVTVYEDLGAGRGYQPAFTIDD